MHELRERTKDVPDEYFVCLVGDMITEEALPTYMAMINTLDGVRDESGAAPTPWARWTRQWVAEENRHGDLMNKYCWLRCGGGGGAGGARGLGGGGMGPGRDGSKRLCTCGHVRAVVGGWAAGCRRRRDPQDPTPRASPPLALPAAAPAPPSNPRPAPRPPPPCSGRVDMRQVEVTIQNLIGSGMDPKTENNPYLGFVYTSFQVLWVCGAVGAGRVCAAAAWRREGVKAEASPRASAVL